MDGFMDSLPVTAVGLTRAIFLNVAPDGRALLLLPGLPSTPVACDWLETGSVPTSGDAVLIWIPDTHAAGVVLGRIGMSKSSTDGEARKVERPEAETSESPRELVLQATEELTLRVGDGSITIRKDGKILIKGKDLVSHAQRVNRIKGGSVAIN